ncbi:MAG TPA: endolytic transglycosylase MltG [Burkholderiales bacterium]|nr:endolytic transglycosylase MltG [Burkholderiales bacterium]
MANTLVLAAVAVSGWVAYFAWTPLDVPASARRFAVEQGATLRGVGRELVNDGILYETTTFVLLGRFLGKAGAVKVGIYDLPERITPVALIEKLARGEVLQSEITFIEGWTFAQMRAALDAHPGVRHDTAGLSDEEVLRRVKAPELHPEGLFFPDTYRFNTGASDLQVLSRAYQTMEERLRAAWETRDPGLPYETPYEALIMASIVEKETGRSEERRMVAAVFCNRLKRGLRLQTDPSVIYGMGNAFDGNLHKRNLETDGPYNTYTRSGLPPTPIALPGQASIEAAMSPAPSSALYFVSRGDGSSQFSSTLDEHNRAVQKYQLKR